MLNHLDLNKLKIFYYVYQTKSVNRAAQELHVTPSAVSQNLKKLEQEIAVHLFIRMHKRLAPTSEAERLFAIIKPFLSELVSGIEELQSSRDSVSGTMRIGAPVEIGKEYFPKLIASFRRMYPKVRFVLTLGNSEKLLYMIKEGELDFAAVDLFLHQKEYVGELGVYNIEPLVDEQIILACSKKYFNENMEKDASLDTILSQQFISYDHAILAINGWFRHHFDRQSVKVDTVLTVDSVQAVLTAIENHIGVGVVTDNAIRQSRNSEEIVVIRTGREEIVNKISLVQLLDKVPTYTEKMFQDHLKAFSWYGIGHELNIDVIG